MLFKLRDDPEESKDVSRDFPEEVIALIKRAALIIREIDSSEKLEIAKPK